MNRLLLVRHGENTANLTLEFSHRLVDYSLTPKGVLQARQTAEFLRDKGIQEVFASPLKRAVETAQIIADPLGLPVTVVEAFREVNVGTLEEQKPTPELWREHNSIIAGWQDGHPEMCFPGGEDYHTLVARAQAGFKAVLAGKDGRCIAIVGHGGLFTFTLHEVCAGMERLDMSTYMPNCAVTELEAQLTNGKIEARLVKYGTADHLSGEAAKLVTGLPAASAPDKVE